MSNYDKVPEGAKWCGWCRAYFSLDRPHWNGHRPVSMEEPK